MEQFIKTACEEFEKKFPAPTKAIDALRKAGLSDEDIILSNTATEAILNEQAHNMQMGKWLEIREFIAQALSLQAKLFEEKIPEERIIHGYMTTQDEGKSTEYCNGWNDFRNQLLKSLHSKEMK